MRNVKRYREDVSRIAAQHSLPWDMLRGAHLLLTGATGMIGSFLIDVLMERNSKYGDDIKITGAVRNPDRGRELFAPYLDKGLTLLEWDVTKPFTGDQEYDYMIHAASNTHPIAYATDPVGTIQTNIRGMTELLEYARERKPRRILFLSSVEIYGEYRGEGTSFSERDLGYIDCNTVRAGYPESKRLVEALLQAYGSQYGIEFATLRLSRVYGPTMKRDDSKALSQFIKNAVKKENIVLKSEGTQFYSYTYVADAVSALLHVLLVGERSQAYNVGDVRSDITLRDLTQILAGYAGTQVVFELPDERERRGYSTATRAILCGDKLRGIGWEAAYTIEEGLQHTVEILRELEMI